MLEQAFQRIVIRFLVRILWNSFNRDMNPSLEDGDLLRDAALLLDEPRDYFLRR
jgi:hypothetical protein